MHVAAPILENGQIVGVVTVAKPNYTMQPYIDRTYARLAQGAALVIGLGLLLGGLFSWWLSHGIGRVTAYADAVAAGQPAVVPVLPGNRELRRLAAAVAHMRERLEGKAYVEEYVYGLTHELKSPLAGIRASAEVLAEPLEPAEQARFAAHIESEAQRLDRIVQRLLELARVEQRTATEPTERVDLAQVVAGVAAALRPQAEARGIGMEVTVPGGAEVPGERFLLEQAVRNLWQNALDFSPPGSIVRVGASRENGTWVLAVADEGPGIPEYAVGRIFERFYSLPRPGGGARGTGLGLPLVASIARLHGGAVSVANRESGGVIAQLRLPA
jgi:two-component system sensor histidine kinase CreC